MPNFKFKDISIFFTSSCCNAKTREIEDTKSVSPCPISAQITEPVKNYLLLRLQGTKNYCHATTITIGSKNLGKLSAKGQYKALVRAIKKHISFRGHRKYLYVFEYTGSGVVHSHGIEIDTCRESFIESFTSYGSHNRHRDSFQSIKDLPAYIKYIDKEHAFPYITNITKSECKMYKSIKIITPTKERL